MPESGLPRFAEDVIPPFNLRRPHTWCLSRCWWYRKYAPGDTVLEGLEKDAREAGRGLWADPVLISPWEYRASR